MLSRRALLPLAARRPRRYNFAARPNGILKMIAFYLYVSPAFALDVHDELLAVQVGAPFASSGFSPVSPSSLKLPHSSERAVQADWGKRIKYADVDGELQVWTCGDIATKVEFRARWSKNTVPDPLSSMSQARQSIQSLLTTEGWLVTDDIEDGVDDDTVWLDGATAVRASVGRHLSWGCMGVGYCTFSVSTEAMPCAISKKSEADSLAGIQLGSIFEPASFSYESSGWWRVGNIAGEDGNLMVQLCGKRVRSINFMILWYPASTVVVNDFPGMSYRYYHDPHDTMLVINHMHDALLGAGWTAGSDSNTSDGIMQRYTKGRLSRTVIMSANKADRTISYFIGADSTEPCAEGL